MNAQVWLWTGDVIAAWLAARRSPRDAMAAHPVLKHAEAGERAAVARLAAAALGAMRRHEFVLGGPRGLADRPPRARALALALASAIEADQLLADAATRWFEREGGPPLDFAPVLVAAQRCHDPGDPQRSFARRHSVPDWFAALALQQFGGEADALAEALGKPAPRTIRANLLRVASRDALATELAASGVRTTPTPFVGTGLQVEGDADLFATAAFARGAFEQQDEASQLVAAAVAPPPGGKVLDLCAGSGGKTLALAALLQGRGAVLAADVHERRLAALRARLGRAAAANVQLAPLPEGPVPSAVAAFAGHADRILVDAPCSGTGSWRRRPEARWALAADGLEALVATQDRLLAQAASWLRPGARLVYATCSLLRQENEARVDALLAADPGLERVRLVEILGGVAARPIADATGTNLSLRPDRHGTDGFFAAVLRRKRS
jgi:16S rRNA (cytosine967-C5)-methyltransferase